MARGAARSTRYEKTTPSFRFAIAGSDEDTLLTNVESRLPEIASLGEAERRIFTYVFTELVNNALEHSHGKDVTIRVDMRAPEIVLEIEDDGIGAFASVRAARGLASEIEAAAELTKGKVTSMPARHSGEGLFFTSKAAQRFELAANRVRLVIDNSIGDVAILEDERANGTRVEVRMSRPPQRTLKEVFEAHTDDLEFSKTRTVVRLFGLGRDFVSRSEARRLLAGLEAFREVIVDFQGVSGIGQGFADEVFRVYAREHPMVRLVPVNMNEAVRFFVERAERARQRE